MNCRSVKEITQNLRQPLNISNRTLIVELSHGYVANKTGKPYNKTQYKTLNFFPDNYTVFRNDRSSRSGGVFVTIQSNITAVKCVDFVTECEIDFAKLR